MSFRVCLCIPACVCVFVFIQLSGYLPLSFRQLTQPNTALLGADLRADVGKEQNSVCRNERTQFEGKKKCLFWFCVFSTDFFFPV